MVEPLHFFTLQHHQFRDCQRLVVEINYQLQLRWDGKSAVIPTDSLRYLSGMTYFVQIDGLTESTGGLSS